MTAEFQNAARRTLGRRRVLALLAAGVGGAAALFRPRRAAAQGFAGLGIRADGFAAVTPDRRLQFPADHGAHPEYRIEWWYLTAVLTGRDGAAYGLQWTLFRQALAPPEPNKPPAAGWRSAQFWMAHAAVMAADAHYSAEKFARGGVGQAGVSADPFDAWIDDWRLFAPAGGSGVARLMVSAEAEAFGYEAALEAEGPLVAQGRDGYSVKADRGDGPPQASYYFSQPFYRLDGALRLGGRRESVQGLAWMDREWSSQPLAADQSGWDWFSLHLPSGDKVMLFRLRRAGGGEDLAGNWISAAGDSTPLDPGDIALAPRDAASAEAAPTRWRIRVGSLGLDLSVTALNPDSWMETTISYWEGPIWFEGRAQGRDATGRGYLEMTGYVR